MILSIPVALALLQTAPDLPATWGEIRNAISRTYYGREGDGQKRMNALLEKYDKPVKGAKSVSEFAKLVNTMITEFGDSHFAFLTPSDQGFYMMDGLTAGRTREAKAMPYIGAWFRPAKGGGYEIQMLLNHTSAADAGLRKGDVIEKVNGQPFTPIDSIANADGTVELTARRQSKTLTVKVEVSKTTALGAFLEASKKSASVLEIKGKRLAYFHLWTQANADFRTALEGVIYGKLKETDGFILDLRDGFGGRPEGFADPFFRPGVDLEWGGVPTIFGYGKPLVVLINEGSRSAKEVLSYILKKSGRATLVGVNTAGAVLGTTPRSVGRWAYLEVPMIEVLVDGKSLEKVGVAPNVSVAKEFDDEGNDLILQKGIDTLIEKLK
ncbi:MAG: PDZ domain-containing protein [Armatimonadetes bacterium]|nr:PDZ domain-containing protein [Armatimonadota bacterium]